MPILATKAIDEDAPESPCSGVCELDPAGRYCMGCYRSKAEIGVWAYTDNVEKAAIIAAAKGREMLVSARAEPRKPFDFSEKY
ncbi:MAG: DUF1289 domain-containing protein [Kordiimonadaceae bacterium]|nr:DUF1289 domain-containing protein [Kordiimonadaceae bacterium]